MEPQDYERIDKDFEYAVMHMQDALHELYECAYSLRQTGTDEGELLDEMLGGPKRMFEDWVETIEDVHQSWCSEHYDKSWEADE